MPKLINVVMQLRKVCNHPFLIAGVEDKETSTAKTNEEYLNKLIQASGKLVLVDKLLPKLQAGGHKVLIFSQMKMVLDLLEVYMKIREYVYERIDGSIRGNDRQAAIDRFTKPNSDRFVFMLSTRAGGLGINLTTADTVIIFDSDWNPQNDMQAQARCHRIGQTKKVKIYRLITSRTYEQEMFRRASMKLGLDQAVLKKMNPGEVHFESNLKNKKAHEFSLSKLDKKEIDALLKYGAYDLFNEKADQASETFCEEDIDQILSKRTTVLKSGGNEESYTPSTFSTATFSSETVTTADGEEVRVDDVNFWEKMLPDNKSAPKLLQRLTSGEAYRSEELMAEFFADLNDQVALIIDLRQQGIAPEQLNTVLSILNTIVSDVCVDQNAGNNGEGVSSKFPEERRQQAAESIQMIEKPRRQRRNVERYYTGDMDLDSDEEMLPSNGLGAPVFSKKERRMLGLAIISLGGTARISMSDKARKIVLNEREAELKKREEARLASRMQELAKSDARKKSHSSARVKFLDKSNLGKEDEVKKSKSQTIKKKEIGKKALKPLPALEPKLDGSTNVWLEIQDRAELHHRSLVEICAWGLVFIDVCTQTSFEDRDAEMFKQTRKELIQAIPHDLGLIEKAEKAKQRGKEGEVDLYINQGSDEEITVKASFEPDTATMQMFPSLQEEVFHKYVQRRNRKFARHLRLTRAVKKEIDFYIRERKVTCAGLCTSREEASGFDFDFFADFKILPPTDNGGTIAPNTVPVDWWSTDDDRDLILGKLPVQCFVNGCCNL